MSVPMQLQTSFFRGIIIKYMNEILHSWLLFLSPCSLLSLNCALHRSFQAAGKWKNKSSAAIVSAIIFEMKYSESFHLEKDVARNRLIRRVLTYSTLTLIIVACYWSEKDWNDFQWKDKWMINFISGIQVTNNAVVFHCQWPQLSSSLVELVNSCRVRLKITSLPIFFHLFRRTLYEEEKTLQVDWWCVRFPVSHIIRIH